MEILKQLVGRLHPLIVHLPIGFIIAGLLLQWIDRKKHHFKKVIALLFLWGAMAAVLACITGYLQYLGEGYAFSSIKTHLWFGISTAILAFVLYKNESDETLFAFIKGTPKQLLPLLVFVLISITGHLGGSITHGEDYLVEPLPNTIKAALGFEVYEEKPILLNEDNWQQAVFYDDLIGPILNNNCISCHNKKRAKGKLLLNTKENIFKGGENGEVILSNNAEESPLYARLILPEHHEDHMPPKDKKQPTKEEVALIKTWILNDSPTDKTVAELGLDKSLFISFFPKKLNVDYPDIEIAQASIDSINGLKAEGIHIQQISIASNFLSVSCLNKPSFKDKDLAKLTAFSKQIAVLDLGGTKVTDAIFKQLAFFPHLTVLKMDNTAISGEHLNQLKGLEHLRMINFTATSFKKEHLAQLYEIKNLKSVFLTYTGLNTADNRENEAKSGLIIEFGNYDLPIIESDSIIY